MRGRTVTSLLLCALTVAGCGGSAAPGASPCALPAAGAQWLAFSSSRHGSHDLFAMRDDGSCLTPVTSAEGDELFAAWSPAGTIAYASARSGRLQLYLHDVATGAERLLDVGELSATSPAFSPDGRSVAFEGAEPGAAGVSDLYVVPAAGGTPLQLTSGQGHSAGPAWSPDGSTLYFVSNRDGGYNAWTIPAAGGTESLIPGTAGILGRPAATPDGTGLAYTLAVPGAAFSRVVLQTLSTGALRTVSEQADREPAFDRTGARLVVTSSRAGTAGLWLLDLATGDAIRQLTAGPGVDGLAAYAPVP
jgi:Tol biopolymer transport system component